MATFRQRLNVAAKAAAGIFSDDSSRRAYGLLSGMWPSSVGEAPTRGARERVAAYADMPWVHALAGKVAGALGTVEWQVLAAKRGAEPARKVKAAQRGGPAAREATLRRLKAAGELVELEEHPFLDLMDGGNAMMTGLAVRQVTALHWDLEGEAFWLKERGRGGFGVPTAAWPLAPDWVRSTPTPSTPSYRVGFRGWQGTIPETEILWLPQHNPSNPYGRGTGLARALADELETDEYAARSMRMTFLNASRPDFVVSPKSPQEWTQVQRDRLARDWADNHEGFWRQFRARFMSHEVAVHEFGATDFRRLQMTQLREFERDLIRNTWGVPPEIMGIVEPGASRATIQRASYLFARWVLLPRLEMLRAILQERLIPEYDSRLIVGYVSPVEEDREFALEVAKTAAWSRSVDEWRKLQDLEPLPDGAGEYWLVPAGLEPREGFEPVEPGAIPPAPFAGPVLPDERAVLRRVGRWLGIDSEPVELR